MQAYPNDDKIIDVKQKTKNRNKGLLLFIPYIINNSPTLSRDYNMFLCLTL